jgi:hypothetical protein
LCGVAGQAVAVLAGSQAGDDLVTSSVT